MLAGPGSTTASTQTGDETSTSSTQASKAIEEAVSSAEPEPSRKRHHSAHSSLGCRTEENAAEEDEPVAEKKRHVILGRKPSVGA
jgi:hypothetical protein